MLLTQCGGGPERIKEWLIFDLEVIIRIVAAKASRMHNASLTGGKHAAPKGAKPTDNDKAIVQLLETKWNRSHVD